jgi:hypothetical protein
LPPDLDSLSGLETAEDSLLVAILVRNKRPVFSYKATAFFRRGYDDASDWQTHPSRSRDLDALRLRTSKLFRPVWIASGSSTLFQRDGRARRAVRNLALVWREQGAEAALRTARPLGQMWLREKHVRLSRLLRKER